ncbi:MAG TPA: MDR family MFS transporter [Thermoanaerobaculia bacterium]|jgi:EmrB/QacA subfamily drug resistance transporter|nr:MDR family MFS transporter [Thermoanaerobaculia bacterium]
MRPGRERQLVTAAILLGSFLAALEATAVATAVPTAVGELGGVSHYSWVFSAYLLTSTTTVPLFGKLADLFGRKRIYQVSVAFFLLGSALSGLSRSFAQLVIFRAIQGLGAGGVQPVAITITGDIYTLEERGRIQGIFSGVWALSSLLGPLLGGLITDALSWRWIFYVNVPFGLLSAWLLQVWLREETPRRQHQLDVLGTVSLTAAVTLLLLALLEGPSAWGWGDVRTLGLLAGSLVGLAVFFWQERRAPEPMLPLDLFRNRLIAVSSAGNTLVGVLLFALTAYVPMFGQGVLGGTAVDAGKILAPILIGWPIASTLAGRMLLRAGYRSMALGGGVLIVAGSGLLALTGPGTGRAQMMLAMMVIGLGLGFTSMPYLLGVQNAVPWQRRGVATSSVQFFRSIGGAVAVAALGALLSSRLQAVAGPGVSADAMLDPALRTRLSPAILHRLTGALLHGLQGVFVALAVLAVGGLLIALLFPRGSTRSLTHQERSPVTET